MPARPQLHSRWLPAGDERAALLLVHGYGEHCGRYEHVFEALAARGVSCLGIDYRGFGRSGGRRAFVRSFDDYLDDVQWGLDRLAERSRRQPFLLGHSQGGLICAHFAIERQPDLRGLVLSSPALRFAVRVPRWKRALAHLTSLVWPSMTLPTEIDARDLTHDEDKLRGLREDPLIVRVATARWYTESLRAQRETLARPERLRVPSLFQIAGADRVVDARVTRAFFDGLGTDDRTWIDYPGVYHEVYQETTDVRDRALTELGDWIAARC
ncbi:MAG: lysophospholipase [Planctomycetes bacterium]|nr:lysophospholipase [Planctomycetota bacterium]